MSLSERNPEWLDSLRGNSPLLERSELEYISELRHRIIKEAKSGTGFSFDSHLKEKLSVVKDNFEKVVKYLKENSQSKGYFLSTYPMWRAARCSTILQLRGIAKSVKEDSRNCSVSRGIGSTVSFIGGLICLAGGSDTSRILGGTLMGLGSVASAGTSTVELGLLREKVKEAEKIIQEDRKYSEKLWNWLSDVSYIKEALNIIGNIDVDMNLKKAANDLHTCYKKSGSNELMKNAVKILKCLKVSPAIINEIFDVIGILLATSMLYDRYRPLFNLAFETYKCNKVLSTACNVILTTFRVTSAVNVSKSSELTTLQKSKIVTGMALDAISIALASENVNSICKEAEEIFKAAEKLKEEAEIFKKLYEEVKNS